MNEQAIRQLDQATLAHALWKIRLSDAAQGKLATFDREAAADCHACAFGKWLDAGADGMASDPEYRMVYDLHQEFHRSVGQFLDSLRAGEKVDLEYPLGPQGTFRDTSSRLAEAFLKWRDRLGQT
ncbi:MAG: CZB domain-containing protein [Fibrobacterota bacterium]|nr:CZB domain-containing protein [Fibrobacterota bacterium]QQS06840.1 MAG: CZB domain-containing protein [Fibrobacterota bacterium]